MPMKYTRNNWLKQVYEEYLGHSVSPATWYRIKEALRDNELDITTDSLKLAASLKTTFRASKLPLSQLLDGYLKTTNLHDNTTYKGADVFIELKKIAGFKCSNVTIIRWFRDISKDARGFRFNQLRYYTARELHPIYLRAYAYRHKYGNISYQFEVKTIEVQSA
jgi:hypothetical protein